MSNDLNKQFDISTLTLEDINAELETLLQGVKPEDKIEVGSEFKLKHNVHVTGKGEIEKGSTVKVVEIQKPEKKSQTTTIVYSVIEQGVEMEMSKGIFIASFCDEIKIKQADFERNVADLKNKAEQLKKAEKDRDVDSYRDGVKDEVNWIIKLAKRLIKKID